MWVQFVLNAKKNLWRYSLEQSAEQRTDIANRMCYNFSACFDVADKCETTHIYIVVCRVGSDGHQFGICYFLGDPQFHDPRLPNLLAPFFTLLPSKSWPLSCSEKDEKG